MYKMSIIYKGLKQYTMGLAFCSDFSHYEGF